MPMSEPCCPNHPASCSVIGFIGLVGIVGVGMTFGWRWVFLTVFISAELDWLIRVWKVDR
jgi:hypothetical protein